MSIKYIPFGKVDYVSPPDELKDLIDRLEEIKRFINDAYPPGIFFDNDKDHEFRLVAYASLFNIEEVDSRRQDRMIWIHDIPELITGDIIAPVKDTDTKVASSLKTAEDLAAEKLLSKDDQALLSDFNNSSDFLKGKQEDVDSISAEGLIAAVLDRIDGNMYFHYSITKWIKKGNNNPTFLKEGPFEHGFKQRELYLKNLEKVKDKYPLVVEVCKLLLDRQIEYVTSLWNDVPQSFWPKAVGENIK